MSKPLSKGEGHGPEVVYLLNVRCSQLSVRADNTRDDVLRTRLLAEAELCSVLASKLYVQIVHINTGNVDLTS